MDTTMTVSTMMHGEYGIDDVCLSVLTCRSSGVRRAHGKILVPLTDDEIAKLRHSAELPEGCHPSGRDLTYNTVTDRGCRVFRDSPSP